MLISAPHVGEGEGGGKVRRRRGDVGGTLRGVRRAASASLASLGLLGALGGGVGRRVTRLEVFGYESWGDSKLAKSEREVNKALPAVSIPAVRQYPVAVLRLSLVISWGTRVGEAGMVQVDVDTWRGHAIEWWRHGRLGEDMVEVDVALVRRPGTKLPVRRPSIMFTICRIGLGGFFSRLWSLWEIAVVIEEIALSVGKVVLETSLVEPLLHFVVEHVPCHLPTANNGRLPNGW